MGQIQARNVVVFGINTEPILRHRTFAQNEMLNFRLLSDADKKVTQAYSVLGPKGVPLRVTFIIGPDGTIRGVDGNVSAQFRKEGNRLFSRHGANLVLLLSDWSASIGAQVPNFFLPNYDGKTVSPWLPDRKAAVIILLGTKCPFSRVCADIMRSLALNAIYRDVSFLGIVADPVETPAAVKAFAETCQLPFPVAFDPYGEVTEHLKATHTPSVWVLDRPGSCRLSWHSA